MEKDENKNKGHTKELSISNLPHHKYFNLLNNDDFKPLIHVIGCGGTGSYVLSNLARINATLRLLGRPGFNVTAFDNDLVSEFNIGRSMFSPVDIGIPKSVVLVNRINRFYGFDFKASERDSFNCNILISCVDSIQSRKRIFDYFKFIEYGPDYEKQFVIIDCGNSDYKSHCLYITKDNPTTIDLFKSRNNGIVPKDDDIMPSCSMQEALSRQSMNINMSVGMMASKFIEETFDMGIKYNFLEFNIENFIANKSNLLWKQG